MKKVAVLAAIAMVAAFAAPVLAETNPFMDVPMNHWAYDAIGQLAAHGILSGYPDGLYKGKQQTTRYEMASALARALAVVDMTKASKQDVEMLKRLVLEFKDELDALGVRVDELDERVSVLENRLGGWHIHGSLVLDVMNRSGESALSGNGDGRINFDEARLFIERTFGENDEYFFRARLRNDGDKNDGWTNDNGNSMYFDRFYVTMPFFMDSRLTVGRFLYDKGMKYRLSAPATGSWLGDSVLTDISEIGFALEKNFGLGSFLVYFSHSNRMPDGGAQLNAADPSTYLKPYDTANEKTWQIFAMAEMQFTEQIGFDLGGQVYFGDNASTAPQNVTPTGVSTGNQYLNYTGDVNFKNLWTIFGGLRFNFNDNIAFKGIFYHQKANGEIVNATPAWSDYGYGIMDNNGKWIDDSNHWAVMLDVKQEALKFTSVWLEYGQYDAGFWAPQGMSTIFPSESTVLKPFVGGGAQLQNDLKYWRVLLGQQWNEKWATHLFYYGYKMDGVWGASDGVKPVEFGLGVQYKLNDATTMGLNYVHVDSDNGALDEQKDNVIRFRTAVTF